MPQHKLLSDFDEWLVDSEASISAGREAPGNFWTFRSSEWGTARSLMNTLIKQKLAYATESVDGVLLVMIRATSAPTTT